MSTLMFFKQARVDGGVRTGIDVEGDTLWERFEGGRAEDDPALLWYVDVVCEGKHLPTELEEVRGWFIKHAAVITAGLRDLADTLRVGFDPSFWPLQRALRRAPKGVRIQVICSAVRKFEARGIAKILEDISATWKTMLAQLQPASPA